MPLGPENKKRKLEPVPLQVVTATALANPPALPPPTAPHPLTPPPQNVSGSNKSRPKRARTKTEKKEEAQSTSRFHCDFCGRDLSAVVRVRCAVCPDYDSCLDCFSVGATLKPHLPEHSYRLVETVQAAIFQGGWSADEEEKLLEGLELYGVGNWEQVAKLILSKNAEETEQHFMRVFLQSTTAPLPDPTKILPVEKVATDKDDVDPKALRVMHMHQQEDAAGWMEKRQDFVYEWDNEAEDIIGDMEVADDDSKLEKDLKAQVLEIYAHKLSERARRKEFVLERGLVDTKGIAAAEKAMPKEEKDLRDKMKVFMRFVPQADMDRFIKGILEERELRSKIDILREGRAQGARTVEESEGIYANTKGKNRTPTGGSEASVVTTGTTANQRRQRRANGEGSVADSAASAANGTNSIPPSASMDSKDRKGTVLGEVDLELMPGAELLSRTEISLCAALKIYPHQYLTVKEVMVRESARMGCLRKKDAKAIVRLDSTKVFKMYDYLLACGWIKSCNNASNASKHAAANSTVPNGTRA